MVGATTPWLLDGDSNPLAPSSIIAELEAIDPRLGLQYHVGIHAFVITMRWPEDDPRRQMIRDGVMAPHADFEVLCPVPAHVSFDDLRGWVQQQLVRVGQSREDIKRMVAAHEERVAKQNAAVAAAKEAEATEVLLEAVTKPASMVGRRRKRQDNG